MTAAIVMVDDWKKSLISSLKEAVSFFGNKGKDARERWVTGEFLRRIGISSEGQAIRSADEPADTAFMDARFQIKELVLPGRRRQQEYKQRLERAERALDASELLEGRTTGVVSFAEIISLCRGYAERLIESSHYGVREVPNLDLLFYFNYPGFGEVEPAFRSIDDLPFRSISVLSNRFAAVLFARRDAPQFLRERMGVVYDFRE